MTGIISYQFNNKKNNKTIFLKKQLKNLINHSVISTLFILTSTNVLANQMQVSAALPTLDCWKGFYVGGQLGGAWDNEHWHYTNPNYFNTLGKTLLGKNFNFNSHSFAGGLDGGFNYQTGPLVLGVEASFTDLNLNDKRASPFFPTEDVYSTSTHYVVAAKGRLGYAYQQWLPYISGGWTGNKLALTLNDTVNSVRAHANQWSNGWVASVGVDYRLNQQFSVGLAYDYSQFTINDKSISCALCGTGIGLGTPKVDSHITTQTVMARLNYLINQ